MSDEHHNLQPVKTGKIYGVVKQGASKRDITLIKQLQKQGHNEHEIQRIIGVHFSVIRSFMKFNNPDFEEAEAAPTPDTQHLHDRIKELEALQEAEKVIDNKQNDIVDDLKAAHDLD